MCSAAPSRCWLWSFTRYVPSTPVALLLLGLTPFMVRLAPKDYRPNPESLRQGSIYGVACMTLILLTGVAGPLIDQFFLGGKLDRREIVATKAICQIFGHSREADLFRQPDRSGGHRSIRSSRRLRS